MGARLQQTVDTVATNYTLDLNAGLSQVLTDGTDTYLYGLGRLDKLGFPNNPIILLHSTKAATAYSIVHMPDGEDLISRLRDAGYTHFEGLPRDGDPVDTVIN